MMKSAVFHKTEDGRWLPTIKEIPVPLPNEGEVLMRVEACGICQTDLTVSAGRFRDPRYIPEDVILGHEFWGEIVEVTDKCNERREKLGMEPIEKGDLVVADPNIVCLHGEARSWRREGGKCYFCKQFISALCERVQHIGVHFNGGFAQYCKLPAEQVVKLPNRDKEFWSKRGYFAEPLACILWGADRLQPEPGVSVAIVGAGPIGSLFARLMRLYLPSQIIVIDVDDGRLETARKLKIGDVYVNSKKEGEERIMELTNGEGIECIIETAGAPAVLGYAIRVARKGGKILVFGVSPMGAMGEVEPFEIYEKQLEIKGACIYSTTPQHKPKPIQYYFKKAIDLLQRELVKADDLVLSEEHIHPPEEIETAFQEIRNKVGLKHIVSCWR